MRRRLLALAIALLGGSLAVGGFSPGAGAMIDFEWLIVDKTEACPDDPPTGEENDDEVPELHRHEKICIFPDIADTLTLSTGLTADGSEQLIVDPDFEFPVDELATGVRATVGSEESERAVQIMPDIQLTVRWQRSDGSVTEASPPTTVAPTTTESSTSTESNTTGTTQQATTEEDTSSTEPTTSTSLTRTTERQPIEIGRQGIAKIVAVSGQDMPDLADGQLAGRFEIRDPVTDLVVTEQLPSGAAIRGPDLVVPLSLAPQAEYRLLAASGAATEAAPVSQVTRLTLDGETVALTEYAFTVRGPQIGLQVSSDYDTDAAGATFTVEVDNRASQDLGPISITIESVNNANFAGYRNVSDEWQLIDGSTISWQVDGGLPPGQSLSRSAVAALTKGDEEAIATWQIRVQRVLPEGSVEILAEADAQTTVPPDTGEDDSAGVDFAAGDLVQLITFVVTLALIAIVIGAAIRRYRSPSELGGPDGQEQRKHEENIFRAYIEGIIVLVILVAILVLALQNSLQAESAASLIGVIAGYALGQRRGG